MDRLNIGQSVVYYEIHPGSGIRGRVVRLAEPGVAFKNRVLVEWNTETRARRMPQWISTARLEAA